MFLFWLLLHFNVNEFLSWYTVFAFSISGCECFDDNKDIVYSSRLNLLQCVFCSVDESSVHDNESAVSTTIWSRAKEFDDYLTAIKLIDKVSNQI